MWITLSSISYPKYLEREAEIIVYFIHHCIKKIMWGEALTQTPWPHENKQMNKISWTCKMDLSPDPRYSPRMMFLLRSLGFPRATFRMWVVFSFGQNFTISDWQGAGLKSHQTNSRLMKDSQKYPPQNPIATFNCSKIYEVLFSYHSCFWKHFLTCIKRITGVDVPLHLDIILLSDWPSTHGPVIYQDLILLLLAVARLTITQLWKNSSPPCICLWQQNSFRLIAYEQNHRTIVSICFHLKMVSHLIVYFGFLLYPCKSNALGNLPPDAALYHVNVFLSWPLLLNCSAEG